VFVDTSAFIAVLADEEDGLDLAAKIYDSPGCTTSALVVLEAVMRLTSKLRIEPPEALARIEAFLGEASVVVTVIEPSHVNLAVEAFARFGKAAAIPPSSTSPTASPTPAPRAAAFHFFTRATISPAPT
jgi:ribonuclease VapC